jgi:hypothetical protein
VAEGLGWLRALWDLVDDGLREISRKLQRIVRTLRALVFTLTLGIVLVLASAVVGLFWPKWFPIAYAVSTIFLIVPLVAVLFLCLLPLRAKSLVRLIDKGYPGNARELAIRAVARKMRDQSIETEELLVETAINEGRKIYERVKAQPGERTSVAREAERASAPRDP